MNTAEPAWPNGARGPRAHRTSRCATPDLAVAKPGIVGRRRANIGQDVGDNNHMWVDGLLYQAIEIACASHWLD